MKCYLKNGDNLPLDKKSFLENKRNNYQMWVKI